MGMCIFFSKKVLTLYRPRWGAKIKYQSRLCSFPTCKVIFKNSQINNIGIIAEIEEACLHKLAVRPTLKDRPKLIHSTIDTTIHSIKEA